MKCTTRQTNVWWAVCGVLVVTLLASTAGASLIVDDSWADGGRTDGADPTDTNWWTSTGNTAIEVAVGSLGLVTGTSGRGIHGTFTSQTLANVGDTITATYAFTTPATVVQPPTGNQTGFRIGLYDTTGKPGLAADITASSGSPNAVYNNLNGYMVDYDVNTTGTTPNIQFRERSNAASGQLMAATGDFANISSGGTAYSFAANTNYTGVLSITKTATGLDLTSSLSQGATLLSTYTANEATPTTSAFGMLAFHVNSNVFGTSATPNTADNGIDFTNIKIEFIAAVPEPSGALFGALCLGLMGIRATMRRRS